VRIQDYLNDSENSDKNQTQEYTLLIEPVGASVPASATETDGSGMNCSRDERRS
jgi:hypothetical protein